jgi:hypothetical protein
MGGGTEPARRWSVGTRLEVARGAGRLRRDDTAHTPRDCGNPCRSRLDRFRQ